MDDLGTHAGLAVNTSSEVLDGKGAGIPGLYAVGTAAVSVFSGGCPGYGATIGPAMVFGYHVGRHWLSTLQGPGDRRATASSVPVRGQDRQ